MFINDNCVNQQDVLFINFFLQLHSLSTISTVTLNYSCTQRYHVAKLGICFL